MQSKIDTRILVILGVFSVLFGGLGFYILLHQADGWKFFSCITLILAIFWIGALSVRFEVTASAVNYRSLFRRLSLPLNLITTIEIVAEPGKNAPQGVPRFYLHTSEGKREVLNVKILPIQIVREFCGKLEERGVTVKVSKHFIARRMAKACLKTHQA